LKKTRKPIDTIIEDTSGILAHLPPLALFIHNPWRYPDTMDATIKRE